MAAPDRPLRESLPEWLQTSLDWLVVVLSTALEPLDAFLAGLSLEVGRWCAVALFAIAALWVLRLKPDYVYLGAPDRAGWRDLRLWTLVALIPYAIIYLFCF